MANRVNPNCSKCGIVKDDSNAGIRLSRGIRYYKSYCKECENEVCTSWRNTNKERYSEIDKNRRLKQTTQ